ncbi:MAG TPA: S8 family serine peptidase [Methanospirillum sp.]|uniref:S8 family serine peptidase n=1 Tax=Methanospirillum sp. TaxID=45200 RepID=UPI002BDE3193|nr:S8 family serine peptidase [Methanospirillum sp.]HWQ65184.1 S8 family serine peptidase [Methanospirillum sp.]
MNRLFYFNIYCGIVILLVICATVSGSADNINYREQGSDTGKSLQVLPQHAEDRIIVRYKPDARGPDNTLNSFMDNTNKKVGGTVMADFSPMGVSGMQIIRPPDNQSAEDAISEYAKQPEVLYAEADHLISLSPNETADSVSSSPSSSSSSSVTPDDPGYSLQWGLHNTGQSPFYGTVGADIDAPVAWNTTTGSSVVIAVVDTGVDYTHEDLAANIWTNSGEIAGNGIDDDGNGYIDDVRGWNFYSSTNDPMDDNGHGTHCAGIIAAVGNNNAGVTGVNWKAKIMPLKFLNSAGSGYTSDAISAILYANKMGAKVISNSWGGSGVSRSLKDAIDASSAVVVCAAGNDGEDIDTTPLYPASYNSSNIIAVAATDYNDNLATFSNYGAKSVDIAAPGVKIRSTYKDGQYAYLSGTSMATPYVSGVAALISAVNSSLSSNEIKAKILDSADTTSSLKGKVVSNGRLNAANAVEAASGGGNTDPDDTDDLAVSFTAAPRSGNSPLPVQFMDASSAGETGWYWNFGDGSYSILKNPRHVYQNKGKFAVTLMITSGNKSGLLKKSGYITVQ